MLVDVATNEIAWEALLENHDVDDAFVAIVDNGFILRAISTSISRELEIAPDDVIGKSAAELLHPDDMLRALDVFRGTRSTTGLRPPNIYRVKTNRSDGYRSFDVTSEPILSGEAIVLRLQNPTRRARSELVALEQIDIFEMMGSGRPLDDCLLALVVMVERDSENSRAIIHLGDEEGRLRPIASASLPAAVRDRAKGKPIDAPGRELEAALVGDIYRTERNAIPGFPRASVTTAPLPNGDIAGFVELLHVDADTAAPSDVAMLRAAGRLVGLIVDRYSIESHLSEAAFIDELTGLPNRRALAKTAEDLASDRRAYGILALDLDDFATINSAGHHVGDRVLASVARVIQDALPAGATVFRPGGDEYVIIVPDERRAEGLAALGERIIGALDAGAHADTGGTPRISPPARVSVGATTSVGQEHGFGELLGQAHTAMCVAKRDGGHQVRLHDQPLDSRWVHRRALAESLPAAITNNELYLEFQPIVSLVSHYVVGFEALSRWRHPRFGVLSPADFLPIAEETSLIHTVDTWVLDSAAREVAAWNRASQRPLDVWVNLSARSLARRDLVRQIAELKKRYDMEIGVELTERDSFASSLHAEAACEELRNAGIELALDDFGVGRSSLFRAVFHGPSVLKIDRSFVDGMLGSDRMMALVTTILDVGRRLGLKVIAEGVETEEQMQQLELMGCEFAQGYLFAPPLTADVIQRRLGPSFSDLRVVRLSSSSDQPGHDLDV